jgi:hypothetical protein
MAAPGLLLRHSLPEGMMSIPLEALTTNERSQPLVAGQSIHWRGLANCAIVLPLYASSLAQRIMAERAKAERALKECLERKGQSG